MYDKELVKGILAQLLDSAKVVLIRFESITCVNDFTDSPSGMERLDSICMKLIAIGESLKNLDKITGQELLPQYSQIDWTGAKGLRDVIVHQYFDVDAEEIFWICSHDMNPLVDVIQKILDTI